MFRMLAVVCCLTLSGCSVAMTNKESMFKLNDCHAWPVVVDSVIAAGFASAAIAASQMDMRNEPPNNQEAIVALNILAMSAFGMSAFMGFGEYHECENDRYDSD